MDLGFKLEVGLAWKLSAINLNITMRRGLKSRLMFAYYCYILSN